MRKLRLSTLPDTNEIKDEATQKYAKTLNVHLDDFRKELDQYVGRFIITSLTAAATLTSSDEVVLCSGTFTVTLPKAISSKGKLYLIKNTGSGTITIDGDGSDTIDESTTKSLYQYESKQCISDGTEWWII